MSAEEQPRPGTEREEERTTDEPIDGERGHEQQQGAVVDSEASERVRERAEETRE